MEYSTSLMKVERIAECSPWSILQYLWPALIGIEKQFLVFSLSGRVRQVYCILQKWNVCDQIPYAHDCNGLYVVVFIFQNGRNLSLTRP